MNEEARMEKKSNKLKLTTTVNQEDMEYLQNEVMKRSQERGEILNVSQVLREILQEHQENKEPYSKRKEEEEEVEYTYTLNLESKQNYFYQVEVSVEDIRKYQRDCEFKIEFDEAGRRVAESTAIGIFMRNVQEEQCCNRFHSLGGTLGATNIVKHA